MESEHVQVSRHARTIIQTANVILSSYETGDFLKDLTPSVVYTCRASMQEDLSGLNFYRDNRHVILTTTYLLICGRKLTFEVDRIINLAKIYSCTESMQHIGERNISFIVVDIGICESGSKAVSEKLTLRFRKSNNFSTKLDQAVRSNLERAGYHLTFNWDVRDVQKSLYDTSLLLRMFEDYKSAFSDPTFHRFNTIQKTISIQTRLLRSLSKACKSNMHIKYIATITKIGQCFGGQKVFLTLWCTLSTSSFKSWTSTNRPLPKRVTEPQEYRWL